MNQYVEKGKSGYRIAGSRVSLDSIVYAFQRGASPESIQRSFPTLSLEAVYGAIAFYLANQEEVDGYLLASEQLFDELASISKSTHSKWYDRMQTARNDLAVS